jgi:hypothetical protein
MKAARPLFVLTLAVLAAHVLLLRPAREAVPPAAVPARAFVARTVAVQPAPVTPAPVTPTPVAPAPPRA